MSIDNVLAERGARYGDFSDHAKIAQDLQDRMREMPSWNKLNPVMRQALTVIADKIARIGSGDPFYDDNWIDIQGYAKLVSDRLGYTVKVEVPTDPSQMKEIEDRISEYSKRQVCRGGYAITPITTLVGEKPSESYVTNNSVGVPGPG